MKKIHRVLWVCLLAVLLAMPVYAEQNKGSITLYLQDSKAQLVQQPVDFEIVMIADYIEGRYVWKDEFKNIKTDLNQIKTANELDALAKTLTDQVENAKRERKTTEKGWLVLEKMPVGVYLIYPIGLEEHKYISPCIVSVPVYDEISKTMEYDILVCPKYYENVIEGEVIEQLPESVKTGVDQHEVFYILGILLSGITIWKTCQKRRKQS